jgi:hypothetical protein
MFPVTVHVDTAQALDHSRAAGAHDAHCLDTTIDDAGIPAIQSDPQAPNIPRPSREDTVAEIEAEQINVLAL